MKNFDTERQGRQRQTEDERTFILGGHTFVYRDRVRPEALVPLDRMRDPVRDFTQCRCTHKPFQHKVSAANPTGACTEDGCVCPQMTPMILDPGSALADDLAALDDTIAGLLEPQYVDAYRALRADDTDPLTVEDLYDIIKHITSGATGRPTGRPAVSTAGPSSTGTPSTAVSSSPVTQAV